MFILLLCFVIFIFVGELLLKNSRSSKLLKIIPEPLRFPLIGHGLFFNHTPTEIFYLTRAFSNKYKSAYKIGVAHMQIVSTLEPEDIQIILNNPKCYDKSLIFKFLRPWLNDGLLLSTGDKWKCRRKLLGAAFNYGSLQDYLNVFNEATEKLILNLKSVEKDTEVDIMDMVLDCALHIICQTAMGVNFDKIDMDQKYVYKHAVKEMSECITYRAMRFWLHLDFIFELTSVGKKQKKAVDVLHGFASEIIRQKRDVKINNVTPNYDEEDSKKRLTLLDLLLNAEKEGKIDNEGVREEIDSFIFGGHDTTTSSISFCLMLLANNTEHQDIVYNEIMEEFGENSEELTITKLNKLSHLERCIKESLRLYPSVLLISRLLKDDVKFKKFMLPAGTTIQVYIFDLHRKSSIYMNPDKFDPYRFLPDNCKKRHPYAYLPFSAGPRNCLGQKYAILEQKVIISSIIKNFKLVAVTKPEDLILQSDIVLRPKHPIKIKFIPRSFI